MYNDNDSFTFTVCHVSIVTELWTENYNSNFASELKQIGLQKLKILFSWIITDYTFIVI